MPVKPGRYDVFGAKGPIARKPVARYTLPMRVWPLIGLAALLACDFGLERTGAGESSTGPGKPRDPGTIVVGRPADAIALDPARVTDNESVEVAEQIYDKLLEFDPETRSLKPALATHWEVTEGGTVWTFHLRPGVRFHDGTPFDAEAVVFSIERQRDPSHPFHLTDGDHWKFEYWENNYRNIDKVEAVGPYTVRITIERQYAPFAANVAMFPLAIVSPTAVRRWGVDYGRRPPDERAAGIEQRGAPVGTGPFRFVAWRGRRIVLERNPDYWGEPPSIERLVFMAIPDGRQRLVALESEVVDVAYSILPQELQFVQLHPKLVLHRSAANNVAYLAMNNDKAWFKNVEVRRAINHAINKEPIVKLAYQGLAEEAKGPLPPNQWGYHEPSVVYDYDPDKARAVIQAAAAAGEIDLSVPLRLYVPATPRPYLPDPLGVARVLEANLEAVGFTVDMVVQPFERHLYDLRMGVHDLCLHGWVGDNGDPDNYLYVLFDRNNAAAGFARNVAFFRDPVVHGLLVLAQESEDRREREAIYARAQELIAEQAPWVPLAHSQTAVAARRDVAGILINPATHVPYDRVRRVSR